MRAVFFRKSSLPFSFILKASYCFITSGVSRRNRLSVYKPRRVLRLTSCSIISVSLSRVSSTPRIFRNSSMTSCLFKRKLPRAFPFSVSFITPYFW